MNTPKKYIHKPTEVEAVKASRSMQLTDDFKKYVICELAPVKRGKDLVYTMVLRTPEGIVGAEEGDYLVKGVKGEIYPVKKEIFEEIYDTKTEEITIFDMCVDDDYPYSKNDICEMFKRLPEAEKGMKFRYCVVGPSYNVDHPDQFGKMWFGLADEKGKPIARIGGYRHFESLVLDEKHKESGGWVVRTLDRSWRTCIHPASENARFVVRENERNNMVFLDIIGGDQP